MGFSFVFLRLPLRSILSAPLPFFLPHLYSCTIIVTIIFVSDGDISFAEYTYVNLGPVEKQSFFNNVSMKLLLRIMNVLIKKKKKYFIGP